MILVLAFLIGAVVGARRARQRGGGTADMVQYGLAHGLAFLVAAAALALVAGLAGFAPL
jgi:hypothetical protein